MTHVALVEDIAVQEALFEAALNEMGEFGPLHEDLILKALRQNLFNLLGNVSISEPIEDFVLDLQLAIAVSNFLLCLLQESYVFKQPLLLSKRQGQVLNVLAGQDFHHLRSGVLG